jgi:DNA-binding response OmpR family regulator
MLGLNLVRDSEPDLAILDWMLPGLTGIEICQRWRSTGIKIPVILLTARDETGDRSIGLAAGADDYMVKPFSMEELLARIDLHLQQAQKMKVNSRSRTLKI